MLHGVGVRGAGLTHNRYCHEKTPQLENMVNISVWAVLSILGRLSSPRLCHFSLSLSDLLRVKMIVARMTNNSLQSCQLTT